MGVGATYHLKDQYGQPIPPEERFRSTVSFDKLILLEDTLRKLEPPPWPEDIFGPIDRESAARGQALFEQHCVPCHGPHVASEAYKKMFSPGRSAEDPLWVIHDLDVGDIGTDPTAANNFFEDRVDLTGSGITFDEVKRLLRSQSEVLKVRQAEMIPALEQEIARSKAAGVDPTVVSEFERQLRDVKANQVTDASIARFIDSLDLTSINGGVALNIVDMMIRDLYYDDQHFSEAARNCFAGFSTLDTPQVVDGYRPRPLEGVWATAPFLHNGSVPSIYELLSPAEERTKQFFMGRREFDPVHLGLAKEPLEGTSGGFWYDTSIPGNLNTGHEFREGYVPYDPARPESQNGVIGPPLTPAQRLDIIEYLKVHRDGPDLTGRDDENCFALLK